MIFQQKMCVFSWKFLYPLDAQTEFNDVVARIAIVPADDSPNGRKILINYENFEEVKTAFGLKESGTVKGKPFMHLLSEAQLLNK